MFSSTLGEHHTHDWHEDEDIFIYTEASVEDKDTADIYNGQSPHKKKKWTQHSNLKINNQKKWTNVILKKFKKVAKYYICNVILV